MKVGRRLDALGVKKFFGHGNDWEKVLKILLMCNIIRMVGKT